MIKNWRTILDLSLAFQCRNLTDEWKGLITVVVIPRPQSCKRWKDANSFSILKCLLILHTISGAVNQLMIKKTE